MTKQSGLSEHKKPEICSWTASFFSRVSISNTFSQAESLPVSHHFHLQNWKLENDNSAHAEMVQSRLKAAGIAALLVLYPALCWSHCSALISHNSSFSSKKKEIFLYFFKYLHNIQVVCSHIQQLFAQDSEKSKSGRIKIPFFHANPAILTGTDPPCTLSSCCRAWGCDIYTHSDAFFFLHGQSGVKQLKSNDN